MEQLVARRAHNPKVTGSSPVPATLERGCFGILFCFTLVSSTSGSYSPRRTQVRVLFPLLETPSTLRIRFFFHFWGHFGG